jgi:ribosome maturation factor RimP
VLTRDREFVAFKGFPVCVTTSEPLKKKDGPTKFEGTLYDRTEDTVGFSMLNHAAI